MTDLTGRVVLVTGGNGGIGLAAARGCAEAGADVALLGRDAAKNEAAAASLADTGRRVFTTTCDVVHEEQVVRAFAETVEALGTVDTVIANAGVGGGAPITELSLEEWRRVTAVNLDGAFLTLREGARHLIERGEGGAMVVVSSTASIFGAPRQPHYAASKAGTLGLMRSLAVELARHRIRVNALLPGWTATDMLAPAAGHQKFVDATVGRTPVRRWADPSELAAAAVYLADPTQTFHTGDELRVDGGYSIF
ncbi:SDR family oxidoreductase [Aquihabitans sp. G128]|uniref:SDR family NAD(P)-dependent oxidoreductase n=1 Tax=Aquihabitans sp. G128 TaxID=2849779 RepID=UPI001C24F355|nr:SDR family NAD(P)-dependent oxidoreductase [Aquihabitans sp. G128]QXC59573.1 SDR family oxidoreductase [Aquihabitans sp. G128]